MLLLLLLFIFTKANSQYHIDPEVIFQSLLEIIVEHFEFCSELHCTFNHSEITTETLKFFPKNCTSICGILVFNNITAIYGALQFTNSQMKNFSIFQKTKPIKLFCGSRELKALHLNGITIVNNSQQTDFKFLRIFEFLPDSDTCFFDLKNNPLVDVKELCELKVMQNMVLQEQLSICECRGDLITSENIREHATCRVVVNGLRLSDHQFPDNFSIFSNVDTIRGNIEISNTNLESLSFMRNLRLIVPENKLSKREDSINIRDNPRMTHLGLPLLEGIEHKHSGTVILNVENVHPDFCFNIDELRMLLDLKVQIQNLHATYCPDFENYGRVLYVCKFRQMSSLEKGCSHIYGDVVVDVNDGRHLHKLFRLQYLYGSLKIQYMKADGLDFLSSLNYIAALDETRPAVLIRSNKYLKQAVIPRLLNVISTYPEPVVLYDNPALFSDNDQRLMYRVSYKANVKVSAGCETTPYKEPDY